MNNKPLKIFDNNPNFDNAVIKGTDIILTNHDTNEVIFRGHNKVIVSGSELNALGNFNYDNFAGNVSFLDSIPSYDEAFSKNSKPFTIKVNNSDVSINNGKIATIKSIAGLKYCTDGMLSIFNNLSFTDDNTQKVYRQVARRICLWAVGTDGCDVENSKISTVINTKWIMPYGYNPNGTALVPFKYKISDDISRDFRKIYHGRSKISSTEVGYFFKTFDTAPVLERRYANGSTDLSSVPDVWANSSPVEAECVVKLKMSIGVDDCREFFSKTVGANDARVNTISLCSAVPYTGTEGTVYVDIRPVTKFNFANESLIDFNKAIDITYYLYY